MNQPEWIEYEVVLAAHALQLAEHGGGAGIRDKGLLESALARPRHLFAYSPDCSLYQLAAAYIVGIAKNHGFVDGNKRIAWLVGSAFLELNRIAVIAAEAEVVTIMLGVAEGSVTEKALSDWLEQPGITRPES